MTQSTVWIGLLDPKSPGNVGSVMRAANCFDVDAVHYTGERYNKAAKFHTDTKNAVQRIPLSGVDALLDNSRNGMSVVCVELVEGATSLVDFEHPEKAYYIFGPEDGSLTQDIIDQADSVVFIPVKSSLNLAATVNVVLYDRLLKQKNKITSKGDIEDGYDKFIRQSRDTNNKLKV